MSVQMLHPSPIFVFDKQTLIQYAQRIVRRELFLVYCGEDHQCVRDEMRLIIQSEMAIADLISENCRPGPPSPNLMDAFSTYMRKLIDRTVDIADCDLNMKEDVLNRACEYDFLMPFNMARISMMN